MSQFDPEGFLNTEINSELDTSYPTFSRGKYQALVDSLEMKEGKSKEGRPWYGMNVKFQILDEGVMAELDREKVILSKMIFLDLDDSFNIVYGKGKNVQLGKLRAAVGQNTGEGWSPNRLVGATLMLDVGTENEGTDDERNVVRGYAPEE